MKKSLSVLLAVLLLFAVIPFSASATVYTLDNITWEIRDRTLYIDGSGAMPDFTNTRTAWRNNENDFSSVVIGEGITSIGKNNFAYLEHNLTTVTIANTVTKIDESAFYSCHSITELVIPDSVTEIAPHAFSGCIGITSLTLGENLETIGASAFADISIEELFIPASVTNIAGTAFIKTQFLTRIEVDSDNDVYYSVDNCVIERETGTLTMACSESILPDDGSIKHIGESVFEWREDLVELYIPDGVVSIEMNAFSICSNLEFISIPPSVEEINCNFGSCNDYLSIEAKLGSYAWNYVIDNNINIYPSESDEFDRIELKTLPNKLRFARGESLDLTGLEVTLYGTDGSFGKLSRGYYEVTSVDLNTVGVKSVVIVYYNPFTGECLSCKFDIEVYEGENYCIESPHPLVQYMFDRKYYIHNTPAESLNLTFSPYTAIGDGYLIIYDGLGNYLYDSFDLDFANATIEVPGNAFIFDFYTYSDDVSNFYGYKIDEITANVDVNCQHTDMTEEHHNRTATNGEYTESYCTNCGATSISYGQRAICDLNKDGAFDYLDMLELDLGNYTLDCDFDRDNEITYFDRCVISRCYYSGYQRVGDFNEDYQTDVLDLVRFKKLISADNPEYIWDYDFDRNGLLAAGDLAMLSKFILTYNPLFEDIMPE